MRQRNRVRIVYYVFISTAKVAEVLALAHFSLKNSYPMVKATCSVDSARMGGHIYTERLRAFLIWRVELSQSRSISVLRAFCLLNLFQFFIRKPHESPNHIAVLYLRASSLSAGTSACSFGRSSSNSLP